MRFIFRACFSLILPCFLLHNKFISVLLKPAEPRGCLLQVTKSDDQQLKTEACSDLQKQSNPMGQNASLKKEPGADGAEVGDERAIDPLSSVYTPPSLLPASVGP